MLTVKKSAEMETRHARLKRAWRVSLIPNLV